MSKCLLIQSCVMIVLRADPEMSNCLLTTLTYYLLIQRDIFLLDLPDNLPWTDWSQRPGRGEVYCWWWSWPRWTCCCWNGWPGPWSCCLMCISCYHWTVFQPVDGKPVLTCDWLCVRAGIMLLGPGRNTHVVIMQAVMNWLGKERPRDRHRGRGEGVLAALWIFLSQILFWCSDWRPRNAMGAERATEWQVTHGLLDYIL